MLTTLASRTISPTSATARPLSRFIRITTIISTKTRKIGTHGREWRAGESDRKEKQKRGITKKRRKSK